MKHFLQQDKNYIAIYSSKVQIFDKDLNTKHELSLSQRIENYISSSDEYLLLAIEKEKKNLCLFDQKSLCEGRVA